MIKKNYTAPEMEEIEINTPDLCKGSIGTGDGDTDAGASWTNRQRNSWSQIWVDTDRNR